MEYPDIPSGCLMMVSYAKYQSAKNRKNSILHSENKRKIGCVKTSSEGHLQMPTNGCVCVSKI